MQLMFQIQAWGQLLRDCRISSVSACMVVVLVTSLQKILRNRWGGMSVLEALYLHDNPDIGLRSAEQIASAMSRHACVEVVDFGGVARADRVEDKWAALCVDHPFVSCGDEATFDYSRWGLL